MTCVTVVVDEVVKQPQTEDIICGLRVLNLDGVNVGARRSTNPLASACVGSAEAGCMLVGILRIASTLALWTVAAATSRA